ncbi:MAG: hypothetical protein KDA44_09395 [Planctomycetales bacterium]|nr:hypothetical protein [Planctomycetales bacterium]
MSATESPVAALADGGRPNSTTALSLAESKQLGNHELCIERGLKTFREVGAALIAIRDQRLYRAEFKSFEAYCQERWGWTRRRADMLIEATTTADMIENNCSHRPANEAQTRPLAAVPKKSRAEVWEQAVQTAPLDKHGAPKITAKHVAETVQTWQEDEPPPDGDGDMFDHLEQVVPTEARDAFLDVEHIDHAIGCVKAAANAAKHVANSKAGGFFDLKQFRALMRQAQRLLDATRPFAICPACQGRRCEACRQTGAVPQEALAAAKSPAPAA